MEMLTEAYSLQSSVCVCVRVCLFIIMHLLFFLFFLSERPLLGHFSCLLRYTTVQAIFGRGKKGNKPEHCNILSFLLLTLLVALHRGVFSHPSQYRNRGGGIRQ